LSVFSELPLGCSEVVLEESVHGFGLFDHQDGRFQVSGLEAAEFLE
jgi:hypothetical protein